MKKILLAGFIGGLVIFVWHAISYMVLPFHTASIKSIEAEPEQIAPLLEQLKKTGGGMYHYPGFPADQSEEGMKAFTEQYKKGPIISLMAFQPEGRSPMPPGNFAIGLLTQVISATLAACLLSLVAPRLGSLVGRCGFVFGLGLFAIFATQVEPAVWWRLSSAFVIADIIDLAVAWLLAGIVLAVITKPASDHCSSTSAKSAE